MALVMLITSTAVLASCKDNGNGNGETDPDNLVIVKEDGTSDFVITRRDNATAVEKSATVTLKNAIAEKCGVTLEVKTDYVPRNEENPVIPEYEILIGKTARQECTGITDNLTDMQFVVKVVGTKLIICGPNDKMTEYAVGYFIRNYLASEQTTLKVAKDYSHTGEGDYTYCVATGLTYEEMANQVYDDFLDQFWRGQWVQGSGFWDAAEILETFIDAYEATKNPKYLTYTKQYADNFINKNGSNWLNNEFNDDIAWICIAYLRIHKLTGEKKYYSQAKTMFDGMYNRAWSDDFGGGLFWKKSSGGKNACINCPAAIAACLIADISGDQAYVDKAKACIDWVVATISGGKGYIYDCIYLNDEGNIEYNKWASTYNQGTFIGACTLIHQLTKDETYKTYADEAVLYTMKNMFNYGVINSEGGDNKDLHGFKGILTRWIYRYAMAYDNVEVLEWLQLNAVTAYSNRNKKGLIWTEWKNKAKDWSGGMPDEYSVFGYSTAVALMFNSLQWWDTRESGASSEGE